MQVRFGQLSVVDAIWLYRLYLADFSAIKTHVPPIINFFVPGWTSE